MYKPESYTTHGDGWKTPANGTYVRPDGSKFQVPAQTYKSVITGRTESSYGSYTQSELRAFSEAQKGKK